MNASQSTLQQLAQRAMDLQQAGRLEETAEVYTELLRHLPQQPQLLFNAGTIALQLARHGEALALFDRALRAAPGQVPTLVNKAVALNALGSHAEALACCDAALAQHPGYALAHTNRGNALLELDRPQDALQSHERAIALEPGYADAYINRGQVLLRLGRAGDALASHDRALALQADAVAAWIGRADALQALERYDEALAALDEASRLAPLDADPHVNRGNLLIARNRHDEAIASFESALRLRPDFAEAQANLGLALQHLRCHDEADAAFDRAIALDPKYAGAYWNKALLALALGDFERGWQYFDWRWQTPALRRAQRAFTQPQWRGDTPLSGKTVLVHPEQGLGDFIQFCRYVPLLIQRGARVVVETRPPLVELARSLAPELTVVATGSPLPDFDLHCPVMGLPAAFGTTLADIPANVPYLHADPRRRAHWAQRLGPRTRPRIGIAWSGNPTQQSDRLRSMRLENLEALFDLPLDFHIVQKDIRPADAERLAALPMLHDHSGALGDFADTAALMAEMDLVISVCTSTAHLAGALGRPVWVMLGHSPCYRWMLDREDSPWYPTASLIRQPAPGDWASVVAVIRERLQGPL